MTASDGRPDTLVLRRLLPVPRERVFAAWLDPGSMALWMCPGKVGRAVVEVEPRVGGKFRIVMSHERGETEHWGEYLTIDPPRLLSFTWLSVNTERRATVVTIELLERDGGTELILTHRGLPPNQVEPHTNGWTDILRKLDATLAGGLKSV